MRRLSGSQAICDFARIRPRHPHRVAAIPCATAAQISPRALNTTLRPSGESADPESRLCSVTCSSDGRGWRATTW